MKDRYDAFGHCLNDHLNGIPGTQIVERDDGYLEPDGGPKVYFTEYRHWAPVEKKAIGYARGRVLDLGCGAGRCLLHLQNKGHDVTGIDTSPLAVKVCRARGARKVRLLSVTQVSRQLGEFDTLLMFGGNFGLVANRQRARWLFRRFHTMTAAAGRVIALTRNPYNPSPPAVHRRYHQLNHRRGRMAGQVRLRVRYKTWATPWWDWLIVSEEEMTAILKGTGWAPVKFIRGADSLYAAIIEKTG